jgi:hypothetical protein
MPLQEQLGRRRLVQVGLSMTASALALRSTADAAPSNRLDPAFRDVRRYVFVPGATTALTTIIDADTDSIVETLPTGIVLRQGEVSRELATLVAIDGTAAAVSVIDVFDGTASRIALPAPAQLLTLGTGGRMVAATDLNGGTIMLIDLVQGCVAATISHLPKLRDVMFGDKDLLLYIAAEQSGSVGVIDVETARLVRHIPTLHPTAAGLRSLTRMPNGRRLLAQPQGGGPISVLDAEQGTPVTGIAAGPGAVGAFPSGTGKFVLVPDAAQARLAIFRSDTLHDPVVLPGAPDATGVSSAWLDSVAFMPSRERRRVLVYDLDTLRLAGELPLPGPPTRGAVTSDSRKLYLPITDPPQVVVVDGETRRITASIALPHVPLAALIAGGWGICH